MAHFSLSVLNGQTFYYIVDRIGHQVQLSRADALSLFAWLKSQEEIDREEEEKRNASTT